MATSPTLVFGKKTNLVQEIIPTLSSVAPVVPISVFGTTGKQPSLSSQEVKLIKPVVPSIAFKNSTLRKQIIYSPSEYITKFPTLTLQQLERVIDLVKSTNIQDDDDKDLLNWGTDLQQRLSKVLDNELTVIQSSSIEEIKTHIVNIISQLEEFNKIVSKNKISIFTKVSNFLSDPKKDFENKYNNLKNIIDTLTNKCDSLSQTKDSIFNIQKQTDQIKWETEVIIAAGNTILEYINNNKVNEVGSSIRTIPQIQLIERRVLSLTTTLATIESVNIQRKLTLQTLDHLLECIQDVLLTDIPIWRSNYIAILSVDHSNQIEYKQKINDFNGSQEKILIKLKK